MTRITLAHPTHPARRVKATREQAPRYLRGGWTVVHPETTETDLTRVFNIAETGSPDPADVPNFPSTPPDGPVPAVLEWVGGDPVRAQAALNTETVRPHPRSTLTTQLEQIAYGGPDNTPYGEEE